MFFESNDGFIYCMEEIDGRWHIYKIDRKTKQVYSCLRADSPKGGVWTSSLTEEGIKYVSKGRSKDAALHMWKVYILGKETCSTCSDTLKVIRNDVKVTKFYCPTCKKFHIVPYKEAY